MSSEYYLQRNLGIKPNTQKNLLIKIVNTL